MLWTDRLQADDPRRLGAVRCDLPWVSPWRRPSGTSGCCSSAMPCSMPSPSQRRRLWLRIWSAPTNEVWPMVGTMQRLESARCPPAFSSVGCTKHSVPWRPSGWCRFGVAGRADAVGRQERSSPKKRQGPSSFQYWSVLPDRLLLDGPRLKVLLRYSPESQWANSTSQTT